MKKFKRKWKGSLKRAAALALAVLMVGNTIDISAFAVSAAEETQTVLCGHHTEHTAECGYSEETVGSPCTHECSEESGCIIVTENCTHTEHDDTCGYVEAVEGTSCSYVCELCADENKEEQPENEIATCICKTDDPAIHATNCPAYVAPENPECYCAEKCTEDNINVWCDVCGVQGAEACIAEGEAVMYADVEAKWGTSASDLTNSGTLAEAIAASPAYIQLQSNANVSSFTIKGTTTLDLNNYTITGDGSQRIFGVDGGNLTLTDTSATKGGQITNAGGDAAVVIFSNGQFTMEAGSITGNTKGGVRVYTGTFTMNGGSITGNTSVGNGGGVLNQGATFIMNGGSITGNTGNQGGGIFSNGTFELSGTVDISGNTATAKGDDIYLSSSNVTIGESLNLSSSVHVYKYVSDTENTFATAATGVTLNDTHKGCFISDNPDYPVVSLDSENNALCLNSCDHANVSDNTCSACNSKMVATLEIDGATTYHHSLKTAFNAAVNTTSDTPGIITLLDNINGAGYITITSGVVTLNLNNKTLEASFLMQGSEASLTPKNGTINSNNTGLIAGIYVQSGSVTLDNVIIEGNRDYDIYIANDAPIIIQSIPNGEVYTVKAGSGYAGKVFAKPADGVGALSKENWTSLHPGGLITENTDGSLAFAACDHSGSEHTTHKDIWVNQHSFICTVCNGTANEDHYGGSPTCLTAATCSFCQYSYTVDHQYTYSATENVITETCIYNCEHSETVTIEAPTEIFVYDGTAKEGATVNYSNSENWQGESNLTPTYENNINAGTATASISLMDGENEVKASATFTISAKDIAGATIGDFTKMTYTGQAQTPVATVTIDDLTVTGSWSKVTNVGEKTTFTASGNFTGTVEVNPGMAKATPDVTASTAELTYKTEAQALVTAGSTTGGTLQYALGTDSTNEPTDGWDTAIPTATNVGTYYVWYKVVGDTNYVDVMAQCVEVTISPKLVTAIFLGENFASEYPYTGVAIKPEVKVLYDDDTGALIPTNQYTVVYSSNPEPINVGEYYIGFKGVEGGNYTFHSSLESGAFMYSIVRTKPVITWSDTSYTKEYTGNSANIVATIDMQSNAATGAITYSYSGTVNSQAVSGTGLPTDAGSYTVTASYAGDGNHNAVSVEASLTITPATPVITDVSGTAITYGNTLSASTLSGSAQYSNSDNTAVAGSFAWKDTTIKPAVADSGSTTYAVVFTPSDTVNYNKVETSITLKVNRAENASNMPGSTMSVPYSNKTVSAVTLPEGWAWQVNDRNTALEVGVVTNATAVYVGTDKGNYENESVTVSITRSNCEHANTEVRNAVTATCRQTGYTGDTYCKDCGECTATGTEIPLAGHTPGNAATCTTPQTCTDCGYEITAITTDHDWGNWKSISNTQHSRTCSHDSRHTESGNCSGGTSTCTDKAKCGTCGQSYGSVNSSNHAGGTEIRNALSATVTQDGYTGDTYCKGCGVKLKTGTTIPATGSGAQTPAPDTEGNDGTGTPALDAGGSSGTETPEPDGGEGSGTTTPTPDAGGNSGTNTPTPDDSTSPEMGWHEGEDGAKYWYENGELQGTEGCGKEIYDPATDAWYWLDAAEGGKIATNKDVYQESDGGKWVRYDEEGRMVKGEDYRYEGWYYFDSVTGAMTKGPAILPDGRKVFYDTVTGQMLKGEHSISGQTYVFDENDGHLISGSESLFWVEVDGKQYWYENWQRQGYDPSNAAYRGKEIYDPSSDAWYWLDNIQQGAMAKGKDVYQESYAGIWGDIEGEDGQRYGKWVRYDENGRMIKGWHTNESGTYYFDLITGTMAKGWAEIDGNTYYFDETTGILR